MIDEPNDSEDSNDSKSTDVDLGEGAHVTPEFAIAESLRNAMTVLKSGAERVESLPVGDELVDASEQLADDAGRVDEQLGKSASDDGD